MKAAGLRVPESATKEQRELADEALDVLTQAMRGAMKYDPGALAKDGAKPVDVALRMKAAASIREEICGAVKQKIEHSGLDNLTDEQLRARLDKLLAKAAKDFPREAGPTESTVPGSGAGPGLEGDSE